MFEKQSISAADQQMWAAAGVQADQTSDSTVNYEGATTLTLVAGKGCLRSFENAGKTQYFAKFNIKLNDAELKESGKQLFRDVYFVPSAEDLKTKTSYTVRKGRDGEQPAEGLAITPRNLLRRFPSLRHEVDGNVPYVANDKRIELRVLPTACVLAYTVKGDAFYKIVADYVVEK